MSEVIGVVKSSSGIFFAKDSSGNIIELHAGDKITKDMLIFGDKSNVSSSQIDIDIFNRSSDIVLHGQNQQLLDNSLLDENNMEGKVSKENLDIALDKTLYDDTPDNVNVDDNGILEEETDAGQEKVKEEGGEGDFSARDGNIVDINSDLRDAKFHLSSHNFEIKNQFESDDLNRLRSIHSDPNTRIEPISTPPLTSTPNITPPPSPVAPPEVILVQTPSISIDDVTIDEINGYMIFTVKSDIPAGSDITFSYNTSDGSAVNGTDYSAITGSATIAAGTSSTTIKVPIIDDYYAENSESFTVTLSGVSPNASISDGTGVGTILDTGNKPEDTVYVKLVNDDRVKEGSDLVHSVKLIDANGKDVLLHEGQSVTVNLVYTASSDDGASSDDYTAQTSVTITGSAAGNNTALITNPSLEDNLVENTEQYTISIASVIDNSNIFENISNEGSTVSGEIVDATVTVKLVPTDVDGNIIDPVTVAEGGVAYYKVILVDSDGNQVEDATGDVDVTFTDDSALRTGTSADGELDFAASDETVALDTVFSADILDDYLADNNEIFNVQIVSDSYSKEGDYQSVVYDMQAVVTTIIDDSQPNTPNDASDGVEIDMDSVTLKLISTDSSGEEISAATITEGETAYYKVILVDSTGTEISGATGDVDVTFTGDRSDFAATDQTIALDTVFSADVLDDYIADNNETFSVQIVDDTYTNASVYENVIHDTTTIVTTIADDTGTPNTQDDGVESDHESVIIKLVACNENGDPIFESDGITYTYANDAQEGSVAQYMAVAFAPDETDFTSETAIESNGTVEVTFADNTALGSATQTEIDGTQDYANASQTISVGTAFSVDIFDDYLQENSEDYSVTITSGSYLPSSDTSAYENVEEDSDSVVTTITDDAVANEEIDTVYVKIENDVSTTEGGDLTHKISLVDFNGDEVNIPTGSSVTVDLTYTSSNGVVDGDFSTIVKQVVIEGGSSQTFTNVTLDDFTQEGTENYSVEITGVSDDDSYFENLEIDSNNNSASGEILDGVYIGTPDNSRVDEDNFDATSSNSNITDTGSLGVVASDAETTYTLAFDGEPTFTSDDSNYTTLKSDGVDVEYEVDGATTIAYAGSGRSDDDKVFEITLDKNSDGGSDDNYTYTQYKNIDHPTANSDDDVVLTFGFNISDTSSDGTVTSDTVNFNVTVNDSLPSGTDQSLTTSEDNSLEIVVSQESFKDGEITLNNGVDGDKVVANGDSIDIYDTDKNDKVGSLLNNGDGTLTFTPYDNYSGDTNGFSYSVSDGDGDSASANVAINVSPVADTAILPDDISVDTFEDANTTDSASSDGNQREGGDVKVLGLTLPALSSQVDQTDQNDINGATAEDATERFGLLEVSFDSSANFGTATIGYDTNGDGTLDATLQDVTKDSTFTIDITDVANYHPDDLGSGDYSLTQAQYESLAIIHDEDNATNIEMTIATHMHEVDDSGNSVDVSNDVDTQTIILDVQAVTDDISLKYDNDQNIGTISTTDNTDDTITLDTVDEDSAGTLIDLKSLLSDTTGLEDDSSPDLDGSEYRTYTISDIPAGTIVTFGDQSVAAGSDGVVEISASWNNDTNTDLPFTMQLAPNYSGSINATIELSVQDKDYDSSVTADTLTQTVYLKIDVNPVADTVTLQVKQASGDEDDGRSSGNTANDASADDIDVPQNAIDLDIKVTSEDDKDISDGTNTDAKETYTVTIGDSSSNNGIPDGGAIYYNGTLVDKDTADGDGFTITDNGDGSWKLQIDNFDNDAPLKFIPAHNDDSDYIFNVDAYSTDNGTTSITQSLQIDVTVKDVADIPINDELATTTLQDDNGDDIVFNATAVEDGGAIALKDVLATPDTLASYDSDGSENLTIKVTNLADGFDINGSGATYISGSGSDRVWFIDVAALNNGDVTLTTPQNYAGEVDFDMYMITTEDAGDSKTHPVQNVSIMVTSDAETTVHTSDTQNEDETITLDFGLDKPDNDDASAGEEKLASFAIDMDTVDAGVTLTGSVSGELSGSGYQSLDVDADGNLETVTATITEDSNMAGSYDFNIQYTIEDTAQDADGNTYTNTKTVTDEAYTVTVSAVTDDITLSATTTTDDTNNTQDSDGNISVSDNGEFTKTLSVVGVDSDGRGNADEDGSEQFTRLEVSGVPEGITVVDGVYAGDTGGGNYSGYWYVDIDDITLDGSKTSYDLTFDVDGDLTEGTSSTISVTAFSEDNGNGVEQSDTISFNLDVTQDITGVQGTPAEITAFYQDIDNDGTHDHDYTVTSESDTDITDTDAYDGSVLREDTQFALSDVVHVETDDTKSKFSITIKDVPDNVTIEGMTYNETDNYYTLSGNGDQSAVVSALEQILITPEANTSTDAGDISNTDLGFDIELTTYASGGASNTALINFTGSVLPVTDSMDLTLDNDGVTQEDTDQLFSIKLDNEADGENTKIVDNKVYIQVDESYSDIQGGDEASGTLKDGNGDVITDTVTDPDGLPSGTYFVISNVDYNTTLDFIYTPASNRDGHIDVEFFIKNYENESWSSYDTSVELSRQTVSFDVVSQRDGFTFDTTTQTSGDEDTMIQVSVNVSDPDSSETLTSVSLDKIPNGFLVYYGDDASSAVVAQNTGVNGQMSMQMTYGVDETVDYNLWNIPLDSNGNMPDYIGIKAPENWSGTIPDVEFHAADESGDIATSPFDIVINPIVDTITLNTTKTFGDAGEDIALNLNANVDDLDGSESVTLELTGLGSDAGFKVNGAEFDSSHISYDSGSDTYTLDSIAATDINDITFVQSAMNADVSVSATMVESDGTQSTVVDGVDFNVNISAVSPTSEDNSFLYDGAAIDGLDGMDTITLKQDSNTLDFSQLDNIEKIDLANNGDHILSDLSLNDILDMTDSDNTLTITGDDGDSVASVDTTGWSKTSSTDNGDNTTTYVYSHDSDSVTLTVDDQIDSTGM